MRCVWFARKHFSYTQFGWTGEAVTIFWQWNYYFNVNPTYFLLSLAYAEGIAIWKVNHTSTDLLLKKSIVEGARQLLSNANVTYEIVIGDLQEAIANENPPKEVIEQFQNRKGKSLKKNTCQFVLQPPV